MGENRDGPVYRIGDGKKPAEDERRRRALEHALDIRKFEIDLSWRRAAYFWAIIAVIFTGYFLVLTGGGKGAPVSVNAFLVACLGLVFSIAWYQANRAGSYWQRNWEAQVDLLEDAVIGPLHKTVRDPREFPLWKLNGPYAFSLSRTNVFLSLFVVFIWALLVVRSGMVADWGGEQRWLLVLIAAGTGSASLFMLIFFGPAKILRNPNADQQVRMVTRRVARANEPFQRPNVNRPRNSPSRRED